MHPCDPMLGLEYWFNRLLMASKDLASGGEFERCDGFVNVMYLLKDALFASSHPFFFIPW
jgi:hypothetical protein